MKIEDVTIIVHASANFKRNLEIINEIWRITSNLIEKSLHLFKTMMSTFHCELLLGVIFQLNHGEDTKILNEII